MPFRKTTQLPPESNTVLLFHTFGPKIIKKGNSFLCSEGIARVIRLMVQVLVESGENILITSWPADIELVKGFFTENISDATKIKILPIRYKFGLLNHIKVFQNRLTSAQKELLESMHDSKLYKISKITVYFLQVLFTWCFLDYIKILNRSKQITKIIIPHYASFPEAIFLKKEKFLYLPDYMPYFYPKKVSVGSFWLAQRIAILLSKKSNKIIVSSRFTQNYLVKANLSIHKEKIFYLPLPLLNLSTKTSNGVSEAFINTLPEFFVFYPTRNRPTKRLSDFITTIYQVNNMLEANKNKTRIWGVLTTTVPPTLVPEIPRTHLLSLPQLSDAELTFVFKKSIALLFTSEQEGNFPTQIAEALHYGTPVIATNIPLITEEFPQGSEFLHLVDIGDCQGFASAVVSIFKHRGDVIQQQKTAQKLVAHLFSYSSFKEKLLSLFAS